MYTYIPPIHLVPLYIQTHDIMVFLLLCVYTADYDPLKSFSLLLKDGDKVKTLELKAAHAWMCQLYVSLIFCAQFVQTH